MMLLPVCLGFLGLLFLILSQTAHWSDSEFWPVAIARMFRVSNWDVASHYKPLFELLLSPLYTFVLSNIQTLMGARAIFALIGLGIAYLTYRIALEIWESRAVAAWAVLFLTSSSFFLGQGYRIRSDLLACGAQMLALYFYLVAKKRGPRRTWFEIIAASIVMMMATPKAIFHFIVNALFFQQDRSWVRKISLIIFVPFCIYGFVALLNWDRFQWALEYFITSFTENPSHPGYFSLEAIRYIGLFIVENTPLTVAMLVGAFFAIREWKTSSPRHKAIFLAAAASFFFMLLHNDRLPFFILSLLPLPCIAAAGALREVLQTKTAKYLALTFVASGTVHFMTIYQQDNNRIQKEAIDVIETYLEEYPKVTFFDATAVLPRTAQLLMNIEPSSPWALQNVLAIIEDDKPELVFFGNRMFYLMRPLLTTLDHQDYIHIGSGIYAKAYIRYDEKKRGVNLEKLCRDIPNSDRQIYAGDQFMLMQRIPQKPELSQKAPAVMIACTRFRPIFLPKGKSFAEIFDYGFKY